MQDEFANRLGMFQTALGVLNSAEHQSTWQNQPPIIFTTKVTDAQTALSDLQDFVTQHSVDITGAAADKKREKQELEQAVFTLSQAMLCWFRDQNDETNAAKVDRSISTWRRMRDQELIAQSRIARDLAQSVVDGPDATAASDYNITQLAIDNVTSQLDDVEAIVSAPQESIASRKALTVQYRDRFNEVEAKFEALDSLILQYTTTDEGSALIAAYQASRIVRDLGSGGSPTAPAALEIQSLTQNSDNIDVNYVDPGIPDPSVTYTLLWQVVGTDPDFNNNAAATPPQQTIGPFNPGETIKLKTAAEKDGETTESAEQEITLV